MCSLRWVTGALRPPLRIDGLTMKALRQLLDRHRDYHSSEPLMLWYAGLLGTFAFPLFYVLRFTKNTAVYDDLPLRLAGMVLCTLLLLRKRWPARLQPYFYDY